jgi:exosortase/archaeosortase family protein
MILALTNVHWKRKVIGFFITVIPIYILNLFRNAMVSYLLGENITDFYLAHNVIAKVGSLIALIAILFIVSKILPEIFDQIFGIMDLPKRNGPIEKFFKSIFGDNEKA